MNPLSAIEGVALERGTLSLLSPARLTSVRRASLVSQSGKNGGWRHPSWESGRTRDLLTTEMAIAGSTEHGASDSASSPLDRSQLPILQGCLTSTPRFAASG